MSLKRELCEEHADQLRATKLFGERFGQKPYEEAITGSGSVPCGLETMQLDGKTTQTRVHTCNKPATVRFSFGQLKSDEKII